MSRLSIAAAVALLGLTLVPMDAEAARRHKRPHHHGPTVKVVKPSGLAIALGIAGIAIHTAWHASYVPAHRAGYVWVPGHYVRGHWRPGHWKPTTVRVGFVWAPGHWRGDDYIEGYWRPDAKDGMVWVEGYYTDDGEWVEGHWLPEADYQVLMSAATDDSDDGYHHSVPR